jgi:hypothetical protein
MAKNFLSPRSVSLRAPDLPLEDLEEWEWEEEAEEAQREGMMMENKKR